MKNNLGYIDGYIIVKIGNKKVKYTGLTYYTYTERSIFTSLDRYDVVFGAVDCEELEDGEENE